jgi:hypothetical protein
MFENIPKFELIKKGLKARPTRPEVNELLDMNNNCVVNGNAAIDCTENEDSENHSLKHCNLNETIKIDCELLQKHEAQDLLRNCLTENGQLFLNEKVRQLLQDNERLQQFKKGLQTLLIENKLKQIQLKTIKHNRSATESDTNESPIECRKGFAPRLVVNGFSGHQNSNGHIEKQEPEVITLNGRTNGFNRQSRHTINLPNKRILSKSLQRIKESPNIGLFHGNFLTINLCI